MPDDAPLVWYGDGYLRLVVQYNALAAQPALEAGADGAINKVFFLVRNFLQIRLPLFHIHMAGGTGAHPATIVVEVDIKLLGQFEDGHIFKIALHRYRGNARIFKLKVDNSHISWA